MKRTKRIRDGTEEMTIDEHILQRRKLLIANREEAPHLRARAQTMIERADGMTKRFETRLANDLCRKADRLQKEAIVRESMSREHNFEQLITTYMKLYNNTSINTSLRKRPEIKESYHKQAVSIKKFKNSVFDEYLADVSCAPAKVAMAIRDECPKCEDSHKFLTYAQKSIMVCPECGYSMAYLDATSTSTSFDEMVEFSQYSYKRVNHYSMHLALVQGKETHRVPDDILEKVMLDIYDRQGVRLKNEITMRRVRETLRRLRLRKAYDHVTQITARLSGVRAQRISPEVEERLKVMFLQMQPAFQRHAPKSRSNFLSYSYVLYRSFQILGLDHMLSNVTLLKGRDKLEANDTIFKKMCLDLGWPIFELPQFSETMV